MPEAIILDVSLDDGIIIILLFLKLLDGVAKRDPVLWIKKVQH
jgi:hypothetical protein